MLVISSLWLFDVLISAYSFLIELLLQCLVLWVCIPYMGITFFDLINVWTSCNSGVLSKVVNLGLNLKWTRNHSTCSLQFTILMQQWVSHEIVRAGPRNGRGPSPTYVNTFVHKSSSNRTGQRVSLFRACAPVNDVARTPRIPDSVLRDSLPRFPRLPVSR